jgi:hypothetical protein
MKRLAFLALLLAAGGAHAACACTCVNGQSTAICQNVYDVRPVCPPRVCPLVPPSVQPVQIPTIPLIGTTNCRQVQVLNMFGQYEWRTVCS